MERLGLVGLVGPRSVSDLLLVQQPMVCLPDFSLFIPFLDRHGTSTTVARNYSSGRVAGYSASTAQRKPTALTPMTMWRSLSTFDVQLA